MQSRWSRKPCERSAGGHYSDEALRRVDCLYAEEIAGRSPWSVTLLKLIVFELAAKFSLSVKTVVDEFAGFGVHGLQLVVSASVSPLHLVPDMYCPASQRALH